MAAAADGAIHPPLARLGVEQVQDLVRQHRHMPDLKIGGHTLIRKTGQGESFVFQRRVVEVAFQQGVQGRELVEVAQRGVVEAGVEEEVRTAAGSERDQADMDDLGRLFADDVDAQELHVVALEDQFQEARLVADDLAARVVGVVGAADDVVDAFLLRLRLRRARRYSVRGWYRCRWAAYGETVFLNSEPQAWQAATRPCSVLVEARAGKPMTSPTA